MTLHSNIPRQAWLPSENDPEDAFEGPWLAFVGPLLDVVAERVRGDAAYVADDAPELLSLLSLFDAIDKDDLADACVLFKGHAGSGKTTFLNHWIATSQHGLRARALIEDALIEGVRWSDSNLETEHAAIAQGMACRLYEHGRKFLSGKERTTFEQTFVSRVLDLRERKFATSLPPNDFIEGFTNQSDKFRALYPGLNGVLHLAAVVSGLSTASSKTTWIIFDNVDLLGLEIQRKLFSFAEMIRREIIDKCKTSDWTYKLSVMTVVRHETAQHHKSGAFQGFRSHELPAPALRTIAMKKIKAAIDIVTRDYDRQQKPLNFQIHGRSYANWFELGIELTKRIDLAVNITAKKQNDSWHNAIVSQNARRFFNHWTRIILSNLSAQEWLFGTESGRTVGYNEYERLIFRGGRHEFPGMQKFNPSAENFEGPLVVNIFNPSFHHFSNRRDIYRNLWAPIRIMQYVHFHCKSPKRLDEVLQDLAPFFNREYILNCIMFFVWARLFDETEAGARNIGNAIDWRAINFSDDHKNFRLVATPTTALYVDELFTDFNFVSTVSIVSLIDTEKIRDKPIPITRMRVVPLIYKFPILAKFYQTLLEGLLENLKAWKPTGLLPTFERLWIPPDKAKHPWLDGIEETADALKGIAKTTENTATHISKVASDVSLELIKMRRQGLLQISNYINLER